MTRGAGGIRYDTLAVLLNILPKKQLDLLCAAWGINFPKGEDKPPSRPKETNLRFLIIHYLLIFLNGLVSH